jgi:hypothetical protein
MTSNKAPAAVQEVSTWAQLQPRLANLYVGPDPMFVTTAVCQNCNHIAVEAKDCSGCSKLICKHCVDTKNNNGMCKKCKKSFDGLVPMHPVMQALFDRAVFDCPHESCHTKGIENKDLVDHCFNQCKHRYIACSNGCDIMPFKAAHEASHKKVCPLEVVTCNACKVAKVPRGEMKAHLAKDCPNSTMQCDRCSGTFCLSEDNHDCIVHLRKMILGDRAAVAAQQDKVAQTFEKFNEHVSNNLCNLEKRMLD